MPTITVTDHLIEAEPGKRLVLALEDGGIDMLHRCGGYARCTTCRVIFSTGEPDTMTAAERDRLARDGAIGKFRLSCQIRAERDMALTPVLRLSDGDYADPGDRPEDSITPDPQWIPKPR